MTEVLSDSINPSHQHSSVAAASNSCNAYAAPNPTLSQLRERKGWSLEEIAQQLRISVMQASALESLNFAQLPRPPYLQGFIRNYCRLLQADPSHYIALANDAVSPPSLVLDNNPRTLGCFDEPHGYTSAHTRRMWIAAFCVAVCTGIILIGVEQTTSNKGENNAAKLAASISVTPSSVVLALPDTLTAVTSSNNALTKPTSVNALQNTANDGLRVIRLIYRGDSWVELRDAQGVVLTSQLNKSGSEQSLTGQPPLKLIAGAAKNVTVEVDGKAIVLDAFTKENVARLNIE